MKRVVTTVAMGVLLASALVPAGRAQARQNPVRPLASGRHWSVTLLTGDVVYVDTDAAGRQRATADAKRGPVRVVTQPNGHVWVFPASVGSLVGRILDPVLFDVTELIKEGDDDAHSQSIPLIVRGPANAPLTSALHTGRALHALGAVAASMPKAQPIGGVLAAMAAHHGAMTPQVTGGVSYVWLDRKAHATATGARPAALDHNLDQIHAPQAWHEGATGTGVTVAVLDTGIDAGHPDLRGKVVAAQDFTGGGNTVDHFGHGTHVAATIAGSGAISGGARKGVAFGARLLIGKVLGDDGSGLESGIIAGMEWAASRAKIINMSLGSPEPGNGTDPMSEEVDLLSRNDHTLFVVAAGNMGPTDGTVSAPGAASTALTVGAVDGKGRLAAFSSRGPLTGTRAIKPEVVAPGVNIVAARAAGTTLGTPIDSDYTMLSGTSMATPHVAGVAALVAQRHPEWTGDQIKAAVIGSAQSAATGGDGYESGAGTVDAAAAIGPVTSEQGVLDLGTFAYPQPAGHQVSKDLRWTNSGTTSVTVHLSAGLGPRTGGAAGTATVTPNQVTVPAHGTASATLTFDPHAFASKPGLYEGTVKARSAAGTVVTPLGFYEEPESHNLTIKVTQVPGGTSTNSAVFVNDLDDNAVFSREMEVKSTETVRVPAGHYSVVGAVADTVANQFVFAIGGDPYADLRHDATVTIDAARAKALTGSVSGQASQVESVYGGYFQSLGHGAGRSDSVWAQYPASGTAYVQPMSAPKNSGFAAEEGIRLESPVLTAALPDGPLAALLGVTSPYVPEGGRTVQVAYAGTGKDMSGTGGKVAVVDYTPAGEGPAAIVQRAKDAGAALVAFAATTAGTPVIKPTGRAAFAIPVLGVGGADGSRLVAAAKASGRITITGHPASPFDDDIRLSLGNRISGAPYVLTSAAQKRLARVDDYFDATGLNFSLTRYTPPLPGDYVSGQFSSDRPLPARQTSYLTPGVAYQDVIESAVGRFTIGLGESSPQSYAPGSIHPVTWLRRPFAPGPYDGRPTGTGCQPAPVTRTQGNLHVELAEFRDAADRFDCLSFAGIPVRSLLRLTRDGSPVGTVSGAAVGDFAIAPGAATYRLSYEQTTTEPIGTDTSTTWTFRSSGPGGTAIAAVPLLQIGYILPLGADNRPTGDQATFTVTRVHGVPSASVASMAVQTSLDGGKTWAPAPVRTLGNGRYAVTLPKGNGGWVSIKSAAQDAGGSGIQQTLIDAYQG